MRFQPPLVLWTAQTDDCQVCWRPRALWDRSDPLYRELSTTCPVCHRGDIDLDTAHRRRETP